MTAERAATYADVCRVRPFRVLFAGRTIAILAASFRTVALSMLIYDLTRSPALAALTYGISFMPQVIGASLFSALPDRLLIAAGYTLECLVGGTPRVRTPACGNHPCDRRGSGVSDGGAIRVGEPGRRRGAHRGCVRSRAIAVEHDLVGLRS